MNDKRAGYYRIAVYPGSFDPVTYGHMDIIQRAAKQFDHLVVAVLNNASKSPVFTLEERHDMLLEATQHMPNVSVDVFKDLLVRFMRSKQANVIVRGIRSVTDFEYELQLASLNQNLDEGIDTIFMPTNPKYSYLSSSMVKEIAKYQGSVKNLVSPEVERRLANKYGEIRP